jgi:hypothetical protein
MHDPNATTGEKRQSLNRIGDALDRADAKNREAFAALEAARKAFDVTCEPLKLARSEYRARVREMAAKQTVPRLPAGTGDDVRAIVIAARDAADVIAKLFFDLSTLDECDRARLDAAAQYEFAERTYETLREQFNARLEKEFERGMTAQARAFEPQRQAAISAARRAMLRS